MASSASSDMPLLLQGPKGAFILYDYGVSLLAVFVNVLVLRSVVRSKIHLTGYKYFLISLGASDLYLCCINTLIFIAQATIMSQYGDDSKCWSQIFRSLQIVGFMANLLNLCGMSVDHLVGIVYPLHYNQCMSKRVLRCSIICIWTTALLLGSADIPVTTIMYARHLRLQDGDNNALQGIDANAFNCTQLQQQSPQMLLPPGDSDNGGGGETGGGDVDDEQPVTLSQDSIQWFKMMADMQLDLNSLQATSPPPDTELEFQSTIEPFSLPKRSSPELASTRQFKSEKSRTRRPLGTNSVTNHTRKKIGGKKKARKSLLTTVKRDADLEITETIATEPKQQQQQQDPDYGCLVSKFLDAIESFNKDSKVVLTWCHFYNTENWLEYTVMASVVSCFIFLAICYGHIFNGVYFQTDTPKQSVRRLVMTTCLLLGAFAICWLPFMCFEISMILALQFNLGIAQTSHPYFLTIHNVFNSLLLTSPLLDPMIYSARLSIVRRQITEEFTAIFHRCLPCLKKLKQTADEIRRRKSSPEQAGFGLYEAGARNLCSSRRATLLLMQYSADIYNSSSANGANANNNNLLTVNSASSQYNFNNNNSNTAPISSFPATNLVKPQPATASVDEQPSSPTAPLVFIDQISTE